MQSAILVILPTWAVFSLSLPPQILPIYQHSTSQKNGKQDILMQPEANMDLVYFSALSYYKSSVETKFLIFAITFSH